MKMFRVVLLFTFLAIVVPSSGLNSRKLEDGTLSPGLDKKIGGCPCNNTFGQAPPPSSPTLPPPAPEPPTMEFPQPPSGANGGGSNIYPSAPTPPSQYMYMNSPPGNNLYIVDPYRNGACPEFGSILGFPLLIGSLLLGFLALS